MKSAIAIGSLVLLLGMSGCERKTVFSLKVGTCFDDVDELYGGEEIANVPVRKCEEPHDNEVFALLEVEGDEFPGAAELEKLALDRCHGEFEGYVGKDYQTSRYDFGHMVPSSDTWEHQNDREIVCFLYDAELAKLSGSAKGAGE